MPQHSGNTDRARPRALAALGGHALALTAGWTARVTPDGATWLGIRGPSCPLGACFGPLACPGCGLTRATAAALQGDFALAFATHPAGPVVALVFAAGALVHADVLRAGARSARHAALLRGGRWLLAAAVGGGWLLRLAAGLC